MPRYLVERTFPEGLCFPEHSRECFGIVERNADEGVTWLTTYISRDRTKCFCIYDAPCPEAVRTTAARNALPVDRITQVNVLDPYFYAQPQETCCADLPHEG